MRMMEVLISKGTSIQETDCAGDTPLIMASQNRILPSVRALIKAGADVHARNAVGRNALMMAFLGPPSRMPGAPPLVFDATLAEIVYELLHSGARIDDVDPHGNTILHLIFNGNPDKDFQMQSLRLLLNHPSANELVQAKNHEGRSPFHLAFQARNIGACEILVRRGYIRGTLERDELLAMLQHVLQDRSTPQDEALNFVLDLDVNRELTSDPSVFGDLLQEGGCASLHAARLIASRGLPAMSPELSSHYLRLVVFLGEWEIAYSMLEGGADVNATSVSGESALSIFIQRYGYSTLNNRDLQQFVRVLLDRHANLHLCHPAPSHVRPLVKAIQLGSAKLVSILLENQPLRDNPDAVNGCYLHHTLQDRSARMPSLMERMLDTLIESGASLTELDENGDTPLSLLLQLAASNNNIARSWYRFVKLLYGPGVDINRTNKQGQSIADLLEDMLRPENKWCGEENPLAEKIQLVDAPGGGKELTFGISPRQRVRPVDIWRP
jgi:ankyrin repeat protein